MILQRRLWVVSIVNRLLDAGCWSRRPVMCFRLIFLSQAKTPCMGTMDKSYDLRHWRHFVFSDESLFIFYHSDGRTHVCCRQWERQKDACIQTMDDNRSPSVMVWGAIHYGKRSELVVLNENSSTKATSGFSVMVWFLGDGRFSTKLCVCPGQHHHHPPPLHHPHPHPHHPRRHPPPATGMWYDSFFGWHNRIWKSWTSRCVIMYPIEHVLNQMGI